MGTKKERQTSTSDEEFASYDEYLRAVHPSSELPDAEGEEDPEKTADKIVREAMSHLIPEG